MNASDPGRFFFLRARLAPCVIATWKGTDDYLLGFLILLLVDEDSVQASGAVEVSKTVKYASREDVSLRQWITVETGAIGISLKIAYCLSFKPKCWIARSSSSYRATSVDDTGWS